MSTLPHEAILALPGAAASAVVFRHRLLLPAWRGCVDLTGEHQLPATSLRKQLGRISFAGQDTESTPAMESAIGSGLRSATEVLALL